MIEVSGIYKSFGKKGEIPALNDVYLDVKEGELFGVIGPDGAGKTTLFRIITTLLLPDKGYARVGGYDVQNDFRALRKILGYMPGRFSLYQDLSVAENLAFYASIFNTTIEANYHLIRDIYVQLEPFKDRRAGALSGGMKQKLALCCALIHKPQILVLDEPTTGVDVVSRKEFWQMLQRLKREGITILVSTPYMDEASMCERLALIQQGRILSKGTPAGILSDYSGRLLSVRTGDIYKAKLALENAADVDDVYIFGESLHVKTQNLEPARVERLLAANSVEVFDIKVIPPTIEDVFLAKLQS